MSLTAFQRYRRMKQVEEMKPENIQKQEEEKVEEEKPEVQETIEEPKVENTEETIEEEKPVRGRRKRTD